MLDIELVQPGATAHIIAGVLDMPKVQGKELLSTIVRKMVTAAGAHGNLEHICDMCATPESHLRQIHRTGKKWSFVKTFKCQMCSRLACAPIAGDCNATPTTSWLVV